MGAVAVATGLAVGAVVLASRGEAISDLFGRSGSQLGVEAGFRNEALLTSLRSAPKIGAASARFDTTVADRIKPTTYVPLQYSHAPQPRLSDLSTVLKDKTP